MINYTRYLSSFFIALLIIAGNPIEILSQENQKGPYNTSLGKLEYGGVIPAGTPIESVGNGKFGYKYIFLNILPSNAVPAGDSLEVFTKGTATIEKTPTITLVQDSATGDWLATNGVIFFIDSTFYLLDGHLVKIIGGKEQPFQIGGQPFHETNLEIKNGQPVKLSK